ncbi:aspartate aminotransferase family protein [Micromonospora sp. KC721]|uniref:aspartate aminotransferase family protein n=1 Tax=Micromonospora sp. KC721 TaxID=2530380 RepID=UPI001051408A|nr:aminotransferase class III-fold pyridoxal phosphate-dependent enzyme [Micromonospora sp. KC721]TDB82759.1 aminotransferase class III-fold pyridoxal phosphate-dependent enzyme [Micromonospora sp. KC721]
MTELSPHLRQATPVVAVRGEGVYLYGEDGRRFLDFTAGIGVTSTGHCHPRVVQAAQEQVATLIHGQYTTVLHQPLRRLVAKLGEVLPAELDSLFFTNSGSEAVEAAMRLARQATGRPNILVCHGGFHGRTVAAASMTTSGTRFRSGFSPLMSGVVVTPFPTAFRYGWDEETATRFALRELDYVLQTISAPNDTAAVIVEPVLGEGGYVPATEGFLRGLRERADRHGFLLILDEVQTGVGRTGRFWGHEHFDVVPDILVTAKGLASGFPLSGIAAPERLMRLAWPGSQGGTYGANAVACAAAVATLDVVRDEGLVANAEVMGKRLRAGLEAVAAGNPRIGDVRGLGLMQACEFVTEEGEPDPEAAARVQRAAVDEGLLLLLCGAWNHIVRMIPALVVDEEAIDEGLRAWTAAVAAGAPTP